MGQGEQSAPRCGSVNYPSASHPLIPHVSRLSGSGATRVPALRHARPLRPARPARPALPPLRRLPASAPSPPCGAVPGAADPVSAALVSRTTGPGARAARAGPRAGATNRARRRARSLLAGASSLRIYQSPAGGHGGHGTGIRPRLVSDPVGRGARGAPVRPNGSLISPTALQRRHLLPA